MKKMKCPNCQEETISIGEWCRYPNAFLWVCPHCGAALKPSWATWVWLITGLCLLAIIVIATIIFEESGSLPKGKGKPIILVAVILLITPLTFMAYRWGGYAVRR